ncbi:MAG TPA: response regulator [Vineibacter sp.]|nr:response regulator [Vineibacter sp.]
MEPLLRAVPASPTSGKTGSTGSKSSEETGNGPQRPPTLLVVEDEVLVRMPVADYLRDCGYRVLEASTAAEAQAVFNAKEPIEIVISDVNMPGDMNGFALAKWIREEHPGVKVILTSGINNMAKNAEDVCSDGPFLEKPYTYDNLAAHIRRLLSNT